MSKTLLFYVTNGFPYLESEIFCYDEFPFLQESSFELHVFPRLGIPESGKEYPFVVSDILLPQFVKKLLCLFTLKAIKLFLKEIYSCRANNVNVSYIRVLRATGVAMQAYFAVKRYIISHDYQHRKIILYPFWFTEASYGLSLLKNDFPMLKCITRVHGCDFNPYESADGYLPFRYLRCNTFDHVAAASNAGYVQLLQDGHCASRLSVAHLGVPFAQNVTQPSRYEKLNVVSVAFLSKRKRIPLLLQSLITFSHEFPNIQVHWCHIGGGDNFAELHELCTLAKSNLSNFSFELAGSLTVGNIRKRLSQEPYDVMFNVSEFEGGVSVALQEAGCAGIPLIATDSLGVRAIINAETGILLPVNFSAKEFSEALLLIYNNKSLEQHSKVAAWCRQNFSMQSNYKKFVNCVLLPLEF